jgi:hypothetical protein
MVTPDHMTTADSISGARLLVWDCGSALYDSYELTAFKRQLDAAVLGSGGRSLSMPHLSTTGATPADDVGLRHQQRPGRRGSGNRRRLPALLRRLFSKVIRLRLFPAARARGARYRTTTLDCSGGGGAESPWSGALTSIPEEQSGSGSSSPEKGSSTSPVDDGPSALRKSQSERFVSGSKAASSTVQFDVVL